MKNKKLSLSQFTGVAIALVISSAVWAAVVPTENRLPAWGDYGTETVNVSDVYIKFATKEYKKPLPHYQQPDDTFRAESLTSSVFNLKSDNGYPDAGSFNGNMEISFDISDRGRIRSGGTFAQAPDHPRRDGVTSLQHHHSASDRFTCFGFDGGWTSAEVLDNRTP